MAGHGGQPFQGVVGLFLQIGSPESVAFGESFRVNLFEDFIVVLHALVEGGQVRLSGAVDRACFGQGFV